MTKNEMSEWHHRLDAHEFEQAPGAGDGQGSLACCSPWGLKESHMTEYTYANIKLIKKNAQVYISSVQLLSRVQLFATHGLQHARLPCPLPSPKADSSYCPLSL